MAGYYVILVHFRAKFGARGSEGGSEQKEEGSRPHNPTGAGTSPLCGRVLLGFYAVVSD